MAVLNVLLLKYSYFLGMVLSSHSLEGSKSPLIQKCSY